MAFMRCISCGAEAEDGNFCGQCGTPFSVTEDVSSNETSTDDDHVKHITLAEEIYEKLNTDSEGKKAVVNRNGNLDVYMMGGEIRMPVSMYRGARVVSQKGNINLTTEHFNIKFETKSGRQDVMMERYVIIKRSTSSGMATIFTEDGRMMELTLDRQTARRISRSPVYLFKVNRQLFIMSTCIEGMVSVRNKNITPMEVSAIALLAPIAINGVVTITVDYR